MILNEVYSDEEYSTLKLKSLKTQNKVSLPELQTNKVVCYGLGTVGKKIINLLIKNQIPIDWIIDKKHCGTTYKNIEVRGIDSLSKINSQYVLISGVYALEMFKICEENKCKNIIFPYHLTEEIIGESASYEPLEAIEQNKNYYKLYSLLKDNASKQVLKDILYHKATQDISIYEKYDGEDYFTDDLKDKFDYSVFCDCGAYNGDTFLSWINHKEINHKKYIGIEASKNNFEDLQKTVKEYPSINATLYSCALGKEKGTAFFNEEGTSASFDTVGNEVQIMPLNELLPEDITFIKMDIEGSEYDTLITLTPFLKEKKNCTLAISAYHLKADLYRIPFFILEHAPNAKIYLRHESKSYLEHVFYIEL